MLPRNLTLSREKGFTIFKKALPVSPSAEQLAKNNKEFSVSDVQEWVKRTGSIQGSLTFFESFAKHSEFYQQVAKPLLSMRTVGPIDAERMIKPIKHTILAKKHNRPQDPKGIALFRASENLKHIMRAKKILGKTITDSF